MSRKSFLQQLRRWVYIVGWGWGLLLFCQACHVSPSASVIVITSTRVEIPAGVVISQETLYIIQEIHRQQVRRSQQRDEQTFIFIVLVVAVIIIGIVGYYLLWHGHPIE